jgi:hypothetical protein
MARIVGGTVRRYEKNWPDAVSAQGKAVDFTQLLPNAEQWKREIPLSSVKPKGSIANHAASRFTSITFPFVTNTISPTGIFVASK